MLRAASTLSELSSIKRHVPISVSAAFATSLNIFLSGETSTQLIILKDFEAAVTNSSPFVFFQYSNEKDAKHVMKMTDLTYMGEINCIGGLVIENDDGTVRMDYTYDRILEDVSEQSLKHISDILFG